MRVGADMESYRFRFGADGQPPETLDSDHTSDDDAMCDAARTVAEMLKEQAGGGGLLSGFALDVIGPGERAVGGIEIIITRSSKSL